MPYMPPPATHDGSRLAREAAGHYLFRLNDQSYRLHIPPQEIDVQLPARVQVTQTLRGAYVDHFGRGQGKLTIQAHTGWRGFQQMTGSELFKRLQALFYAYTDLCATSDPETVSFQVINDIHGTALRVAPTQWESRASKSNPLIQTFTFSAIILEDLLNPEPLATIAPFLVTSSGSGGSITIPPSDEKLRWTDLLDNPRRARTGDITAYGDPLVDQPSSRRRPTR